MDPRGAHRPPPTTVVADLHCGTETTSTDHEWFGIQHCWKQLLRHPALHTSWPGRSPGPAPTSVSPTAALRGPFWPPTAMEKSSPPSTASHTARCAAPLRLEKRQVAAWHRVHDSRSTRFLGRARVSQPRRPLEAAALLVSGAGEQVTLSRRRVEQRPGLPWEGSLLMYQAVSTVAPAPSATRMPPAKRSEKPTRAIVTRGFLSRGVGRGNKTLRARDQLRPVVRILATVNAAVRGVGPAADADTHGGDKAWSMR